MVRYVPLTSIAIEAYEELAKGKKIGDLLCVNSEGVMKTTAYWFKGAVDLAGIVDYHWHDNRHTACSRWAMGDVPLASIAQYVGHATIQMTMRYAHLMPDQHTKDLEKMMAFYAKPVARAEEQSATRSATGTFGPSMGSSKSL
jgi:integrase